MSLITGTVVNSRIVPSDSSDNYATHDAQFGRDGWRSVADITERDAIYSSRRVEGMAVWVQSISAGYQLIGGTSNSNWKPLSLGTNQKTWVPLAGQGILISSPATSSYLFSVNDYIGKTEVASISSGLLSQITNLSGSFATNQDLYNLDLDLQSQISQFSTTSINGINASDVVIDTINTFNTFGGGEWLINANNGVSSRTSKILANWNAYGITFTESSTTDLSGSTNNIVFYMDNITSYVRLKATSLSGNWSVKFRKNIL
jgi:hypothetical protein